MSTILPGKAAARIQRAAKNFSFRNKRRKAVKKIQPIVRGMLGRQRADWIKKSTPKTEEECIAYMHHFIGQPVWLETTIDIPYCTHPIYYRQLNENQKLKLRMMTLPGHWKWPISISQAHNMGRLVHNFIGYWKQTESIFGAANPLRFFAKRSFRVRFQAKYDKFFSISLPPEEHGISLMMASSFIYIKPVGLRFVQHYYPKTIAGVMDKTSESMGFERLIKTSWSRQQGVTRAPTQLVINHEVYSNPTWPNGGLGKPQILQQVAKVVLGIEDTQEAEDSMGWNEFDLLKLGGIKDVNSFYLLGDKLVQAVKLHNDKLIAQNKILRFEGQKGKVEVPLPISDVVLPTIPGENSFLALPPYIISTDRNTPTWMDIRTKFQWRLAWPITMPGFKEGKEDIIASNDQAFGDMLMHSEVRKKVGDPRWKGKHDARLGGATWEDSMRPELEKFTPKLKF